MSSKGRHIARPTKEVTTMNTYVTIIRTYRFRPGEGIGSGRNCQILAGPTPAGRIRNH
jgi:hypothetical protein